MFGWIFRGSLSRRNLFRYWDGKTWRADDPLAIQVSLESHPVCRWDVHPQLAEQGDLDAYEICLKAICDVFHVKRFTYETAEGLTQKELMDLLTSFADFMERLKKNTASSQTLPATMGATQRKSKSATTSDSSASTSTQTDAEPGKPTSLDLEPMQPQVSS